MLIHIWFWGVDSEIVLRLGGTFLGGFFFPGEPKDWFEWQKSEMRLCF